LDGLIPIGPCLCGGAMWGRGHGMRQLPYPMQCLGIEACRKADARCGVNAKVLAMCRCWTLSNRLVSVCQHTISVAALQPPAQVVCAEERGIEPILIIAILGPDGRGRSTEQERHSQVAWCSPHKDRKKAPPTWTQEQEATPSPDANFLNTSNMRCLESSCRGSPMLIKQHQLCIERDAPADSCRRFISEHLGLSPNPHKIATMARQSSQRVLTAHEHAGPMQHSNSC
jgi:hypothetical protein